MSVDYFRDTPDLTEVPPNEHRHFNLRKMTPFGARLITEVIGCAAVDPAAVQDERASYYPTQYGYDAANAANKFIRVSQYAHSKDKLLTFSFQMRLNNGIVPLESIRGGLCRGRTDGLCSLDKFVASQTEAMKLANYDFACFANYTLPANTTAGHDWDGTISESTAGMPPCAANIGRPRSDLNCVGIEIHDGAITADYISRLFGY